MPVPQYIVTESSLRIWRVCRIKRFLFGCVRIIPPHMEGISVSILTSPGAQNHPSAYGGYN